MECAEGPVLVTGRDHGISGNRTVFRTALAVRLRSFSREFISSGFFMCTGTEVWMGLGLRNDIDYAQLFR